MWPWGHLAAGYLLYRLVTRARAPEALPALAVALGTQLPDLIDKPLAWTLQILPNGRSLGHSLITMGPMLVLLVLLAGRRHRKPALALAAGTLVHLATDALYPVLNGRFYYAGFLGWPVVPPIDYGTESQGILAHFLTFELTARSGFELLLFAAGATLWVVDGMPGLRLLARTAKNSVVRVHRAVRGS